eukprot:235931_1
MGSCCSICCLKCLAHNTCCKCWCGCCAVCITKQYDKENVEGYENKEAFLQDMQNWKTGDLFLQSSTGSIHSQILSNSPWSHVGLIYRKDNNKFCQTGYEQKFDAIETNQEADGKIAAHIDYSDAEILIFETIMYQVADDPENKYCRVKTTMLADAKKLFYNKLWNPVLTEKLFKNYYVAHRKLNIELSNKQKDALEQAVIKLNGTKYGGQDMKDMSAFGAGLDFGCCYCPFECCEEEGTKEKNLDQLFCSETIAYCLQQAGIITDKIAADELTPADFSSKNLVNFTANGKDPYGKEILYG